MAQRDSAFLWETEALRSVSRLATPPTAEERSSRDDWVTLREASEATGVPVATLRKWALRDDVPSYLEETPVGQLRMVSLQGIYRRAEELGREVKRVSPPPKVVDLPGAQPRPEIPEGTMLVPLDAWTKVLNQLGNLHEAGQQLAEARERAAKAETEATFLRERLAELRAELAQESPNEPRKPSLSKVSLWSTVRGLWKRVPRR